MNAKVCSTASATGYFVICICFGFSSSDDQIEPVWVFAIKSEFRYRMLCQMWARMCSPCTRWSFTFPDSTCQSKYVLLFTIYPCAAQRLEALPVDDFQFWINIDFTHTFILAEAHSEFAMRSRVKGNFSEALNIHIYCIPWAHVQFVVYYVYKIW